MTHRTFYEFLLKSPQRFNLAVRHTVSYMNNQASRTNMVKQQLRTGDVLNETILALYNEIARDEFVPNQFKHFAYSDMQIDLPHHQRMMTPLEEAKLLQALALRGGEVVLEVGTGTGFLTALLSRLCKKVISVDYYPDFTLQARRLLTEHQRANVELVTGDGSQGWLDLAPFDVIVFTGAMEQLTDIQRLQLLPGGKLFAIIGKQPVMQGQLHTLDHNGHWTRQVVFETCIPPLVDQLKYTNFDFQDKVRC